MWHVCGGEDPFFLISFRTQMDERSFCRVLILIFKWEYSASQISWTKLTGSDFSFPSLLIREFFFFNCIAQLCRTHAPCSESRVLTPGLPGIPENLYVKDVIYETWYLQSRFPANSFFVGRESFIFFIIILYWDIVDLQCHVSRYGPKWFSCTYICIYSFSDSFPVVGYCRVLSRVSYAIQ